jgi:hypothetical protein
VDDPYAQLGTWKYYIDYILQSNDFDDESKKKILNGFSLLRQKFTDKWLQDILQQGHPLIYLLTNRAPWSQNWVAELGVKLEGLKDVPKIEDLISRLKITDEYRAAICELDSAYRLNKADFDIELGPKVGKKYADILAKNGNEEFYFEVTCMEESKKSKASSTTNQSLIMPYIFDQDVRIYFQIYKILYQPRLNYFRKQIEDGIAEVKATIRYKHIHEERVLDYLIVHKDFTGNVQALANDIGMKLETSGPPVEIDDIRRLENKFWDKNNLKQLPSNKPGVIVVYASLINFGNEESFYDEVVNQIEESIYAYPNIILGIVINDSVTLFEKDDKLIQKPNYILKKTVGKRLTSENILIIKNKLPQLPINEKIIEAFTT